MNISSLNVSTRLAIGFSAVFVGALILASAGWYGIQREARTATRVLEHDVEFMRAVADIRARVQMMRRFEKDMLLVLPDVKKAAEYKKSWDDARARANELVADARKVAAVDSERKRLDQFAAFMNGYGTGMQQTYDAIVAGEIDTSAAGYKKVAEFRQQIRDTETVTGELFDGANKRMHAAKPELEATERRMTYFLGIVTIAVLLLAAGLGVLITRSIVGQLGGEPAYAANVAARIADGDLSVQVALKPGDVTSLLAALSRTVRQLSTMVGQIKSASEVLVTGAREISQGVTDLSSRTEEQASALEESSAGMQQMAATVANNAASARRADELATQSSQMAMKGSEAVRDTVGTMNAINDSSKKIADIIGVIDGIAFQTNILALNAAVEAARAGEQGRGFAVVASEVRSLAQRSAAAAKEIKGLINDSVAKVESGSRQALAAGQAADEIVDSIKRVSGLVAEISGASQEQSRSIEQVSETMTQLDHVTQQNAAMVEQANAAASGQDEQARQLALAVEKFKLDDARAGAVHANTRTHAAGHSPAAGTMGENFPARHSRRRSLAKLS